jgi:DNA-binding Xre family transcriptional regulator
LIRYKINLLSALKNAGYNTNKIRKEKIFNESQLQQMRDNKLLTQDVLNKVCTLLNCQPGDLLEYIPDEPTETQLENE